MDARHSSQVFVAPPLPTWPKEVHPFEPVHGYFQRLAHKNGLLSVSALMESMGISGRRPAADLLFRIAEQFPGVDVLKLRQSTAIVDSKVHLNGQAFRSVDYSYRWPRVCSGCLGEARYYRNWFDLKILQACPIHNLSLDGQEGDVRLAWWSPEIGILADGAAIKSRPVSYSTRWEQYVLGRMGVLPADSIGFLDAHPLNDVTQACLVLGRAIIKRAGEGPKSKKRLDAAQEIRMGFEHLSGGKDGLLIALRSFLPEMKNINGRSDLKFAMWSSFGWLYEMFDIRKDAPIFQEMRSVCDQAAAELNIYSRKRLPRPDILGRPLTLKDLSIRLGLVPNRVLEIARHIGVVRPGHPYRHWYSFSPQDVEVIEKSIEELVPRHEAIQIIGSSKSHFSDLCASGQLRAVTKIGGGSIGCEQFLRSELEAIKRLNTSILAEDYRCKRNLPRRAVRVKSAMRLSQVAYTLNVCTSTVRELLALGLVSLADERVDGVRLMFDAGSVQKFRSAYISVGALAATLGRRSNQVACELRALGVSLIPVSKGLTGIIKRSDAVGVGLLKEAECTPFDAFWDELEAHWLKTGSVSIISKRSGSSVEVTSGGRDSVAELKIVSNRLNLVVTAIEDNSPSRFKTIKDRRDQIEDFWPEAKIATDLYMGYEIFEACPISCVEGLTLELADWLDDRLDRLRWVFSRKHQEVQRALTSRASPMAGAGSKGSGDMVARRGGGDARSIYA